MERLPDAPWIVEAETKGAESPEKVECPECGAECEYIYLDPSGYACGCDRCLKVRDAFDWLEERRQRDAEV